MGGGRGKVDEEKRRRQDESQGRENESQKVQLTLIGLLTSINSNFQTGAEPNCTKKRS